MANREFVMLSHTLKLSEITSYSLGSWYASEKLDGMRAIWLPDSCGREIRSLPFANLEKDKSNIGSRAATGLWSRYAKPIWAPSWWLESLPRDKALDGELWMGRGCFQQLTSVCKDHQAGDGWNDVKFCVFDSPSHDAIYRDGKIHNNTLKKHFKGVWDWCKRELAYDYQLHSDPFDRVYHLRLKPLMGKYLVVHPQEVLPWRNSEANERVSVFLNQVLETGGEGLILRHPQSVWEPIRARTSLKVKPDNSAEAVVTGFTMGVGRLEGLIGSLEVEIVDVTGQRRAFKLGTGLSDRERAWPSTLFTVGTTVTYLYRELTQDGIPREARFLRVRSDL